MSRNVGDHCLLHNLHLRNLHEPIPQGDHMRLHRPCRAGDRSNPANPTNFHEFNTFQHCLDHEGQSLPNNGQEQPCPRTAPQRTDRGWPENQGPERHVSSVEPSIAPNTIIATKSSPRATVEPSNAVETSRPLSMSQGVQLAHRVSEHTPPPLPAVPGGEPPAHPHGPKPSGKTRL